MRHDAVGLHDLLHVTLARACGTRGFFPTARLIVGVAAGVGHTWIIIRSSRVVLVSRSGFAVITRIALAGMIARLGIVSARAFLTLTHEVINADAIDLTDEGFF